MTEQQHPITPPPELVREWQATGPRHPQKFFDYFATQAARWGADTELEACCEVLARELICDGKHVATDLRAVRRPKPLSLKEQSLTALEQVDEWAVANMSHLAIHDDLVAGVDTIRRALESLPD